ncbi:unnamed protein product, partial [Brenthis ino]
MKFETDHLKLSIESLLKAVKSTDLANYILIPFGDQDVGPSIISNTTSGLLDVIELLEVSGGQDCHENSLAAIEKALQVSLPKSSQVVIFQSGECEQNDDPRQIENDNAYNEITSSCGGSIFHLTLGTFRDAFKYIKEITKVDWTDIDTHREFRHNKQFTLTIDTYTKDIVVSISGDNPTLQISNIFGNSITVNKIVEHKTMLVVRIQDIEVGEYIANINCQGPAIATFYRKKEINFEYGFSSLQPNSLRETVSKPIPGSTTFMLISLPDVSSVELISVRLQASMYEIKNAEFRVLDESRGLYVAKIFITPELNAFRITVTCRDKLNYKEITGTTALLEPQKIVTPSVWSTPSVEMIENEPPLIDFGTSYKTACKVKSYPKPDIWWEDNRGIKLSSESALLEIPFIYISYVSIQNATHNETIYCKCKNAEGENSLSIDLYVNRTFTFDVKQFPTDTTIKYGDEGKLFCEVDAYPEADVKWYHNDTLIEETDNIHIVPDQHMLFIDNMNIENTGEYKCEVANNVETKTFLANVYISGLEAPEIEVQESEIILKPGDWTEQQCTVIKGIPVPEVTWKYKSTQGDADKLPDGVYVDGKLLKIPSADTNHGGFYVCEAVNFLGMDDREVAVKVQYAPKIKNGDEVKVVHVGDLVEFPCEVDAVPKADVYWDMYQDDVIIAFDNRHHTDDRNTHRFYASSYDSGMYHCIAQNDMGRAIRTVTLNVLVPPYIERLPWETLTVRTGMNVIVACNVRYGNPVPSTRWQYITPMFDRTVLKRGAGRLDLVLENVTRKHEGTYECIAENDVSIDSVKVLLKTV